MVDRTQTRFVVSVETMLYQHYGIVDTRNLGQPMPVAAHRALDWLKALAEEEDHEEVLFGRTANGRACHLVARILTRVTALVDYLSRRSDDDSREWTLSLRQYMTQGQLDFRRLQDRRFELEPLPDVDAIVKRTQTTRLVAITCSVIYLTR